MLCSSRICASAGEPVVSLRSPDGSVELSLALEARDGQLNVPVYRVSYRGKELIAGSRLGLELAGSGGFALRLTPAGSGSSLPRGPGRRND